MRLAPRFAVIAALAASMTFTAASAHAGQVVERSTAIAVSDEIEWPAPDPVAPREIEWPAPAP